LGKNFPKWGEKALIKGPNNGKGMESKTWTFKGRIKVNEGRNNLEDLLS